MRTRLNCDVIIEAAIRPFQYILLAVQRKRDMMKASRMARVVNDDSNLVRLVGHREPDGLHRNIAEDDLVGELGPHYVREKSAAAGRVGNQKIDVIQPAQVRAARSPIFRGVGKNGGMG